LRDSEQRFRSTFEQAAVGVHLPGSILRCHSSIHWLANQIITSL
jgi:hypothetical protein